MHNLKLRSTDKDSQLYLCSCGRMVITKDNEQIILEDGNPQEHDEYLEPFEKFIESQNEQQPW